MAVESYHDRLLPIHLYNYTTNEKQKRSYLIFLWLADILIGKASSATFLLALQLLGLAQTGNSNAGLGRESLLL